MNSSRYLEPLQKVKEKFPKVQLIGDLLLIQVIEDEEFKTSSGIIIAKNTSARQITSLVDGKPTFCQVLLSGEGYYDEEGGGDVKLDSSPGDIILVEKASIKPITVFGPLLTYGEVQLGLVKDSAVQMRFAGGPSTFNEYFKELNELIKTS